MTQNTIIPPQVISLLTTFQCTAACKNCCFGCNPTLKKKMTFSEMKGYIDRSLVAYGQTIKVLVLTGGECLLLGRSLENIIEYAKSKKILVRIVTNGYWAQSKKIAFNKLKKLVDLGLTEINFSTGDDHQEWVPYDNIVYGCIAACDLKITCVVNVETHSNAKFHAQSFFNDDRLKPYLIPGESSTSLMIQSGAWIKFNRDSNISYEDLLMNQDNAKGCTSLFNGIIINTYGEMLACCGLPSEYIIPFRLGNLSHSSIDNLYVNQFNDFLKIWLFVEGPMNILKFIYQKRNINYNYITGHICSICSEIFKDPENILVLKNNYKEVLSNVLIKYSLLTKSLNLM